MAVRIIKTYGEVLMAAHAPNSTASYAWSHPIQASANEAVLVGPKARAFDLQYPPRFLDREQIAFTFSKRRLRKDMLPPA